MAFARSPLQKRSRPHRRLSPTVQAGLLRCVYTLGLQPRGTACEMEGRGGSLSGGRGSGGGGRKSWNNLSLTQGEERGREWWRWGLLLAITVVQRPAGKVGQTGRKKKRRRGRHERRRKEEEDVAAGERRGWEESKNHHHHVHFTSFYGLEFQSKYVKKEKTIRRKEFP